MKSFLTFLLTGFSIFSWAESHPKTLTLDIVIEKYEKQSIVFDRYVLVTRILTLNLVEVSPLKFCEISRPDSCFDFSPENFCLAKDNVRASYQRPIQQMAIGTAAMSLALALFPSFLMYSNPQKVVKPMGVLAAIPVLLIFVPFATVGGVMLASEMIKWNRFERFFYRKEDYFRWKLSLSLADTFYQGDFIAQVAVYAPTYPLK